MKMLGTALVGWFIPGGAYLMRRRYLQFALAMALVLSATVAGIALHGANLWPGPADLQGLDGFTAGLAQAGALVRMLAGAPYLLGLLGHYSQSFVGGQTHEYGTTLLALAGLFNLLALGDGLTKEKQS